MARVMTAPAPITRMYRYPLPPPGLQMIVFVPSGSVPRYVGIGETSKPNIWFEVQTNSPDSTHWTINVVGTGVETPSRSSYVGSYKLGPSIWHVFAKRKKEEEPQAVSLEIVVGQPHSQREGIEP